MEFNRLNENYEQIIAPPNPEPESVVNEKILKLATYIHENGESIQNYLVDHKEHMPLLQRIGQIQVKDSKAASLVKDIHNSCALLELKVLLKSNEPKKLSEWVLQNKSGISAKNPKELFEHLSQARKQLIGANKLDPEVGGALSDLVTFGLGLKGQKDLKTVKTTIASFLRQGTLEALAHWMNSEKISLKNSGLSNDDLYAIAPFLHYVNCRGFMLDDPEIFIASCHNAHQLMLSSDKVRELKKLPPHLQILECDYCPNLKTINLSNNKLLREVNCNNCPISTLDLSNNPLLRSLKCENCTKLNALDLSNNLQLRQIVCNSCRMLRSLGSSLSNALEKLECISCPNLAQLPQLPATAVVYSRGCPCGDLETFTVSSEDLEKNPKQVLLDLGKFLLQNKPMPNIVYLNSPGIDAGGLRRQLVATLCENLFKKDEDGYDIPILDDEDALRTFARLLGLGIPTSTNLHPSFFHALFALSDEELESSLSEPLKQKLYMARHGVMDCEPQEVAEESNLLTSIAIVAKELHTRLGGRFREFGKNIPEFITIVQGVQVTRENLKQSIVCENTKYKIWINHFIDELPNDQLKNVVLLLTGSYTLGEDPITFEVYPKREHASSSTIIHTCSKRMDLPSDLNEAQLCQELKAQLALLKSFNAA